MSTPCQPIYDCILLFCGRTYRMHASIVRIICTEDEKKGIDFPTKCLYVEESKKERKAVGEEACGRSGHSYIKYTKYGKCLHVCIPQLSLCILSYVLSRVHGGFLFE